MSFDYNNPNYLSDFIQNYETLQKNSNPEMLNPLNRKERKLCKKISTLINTQPDQIGKISSEEVTEFKDLVKKVTSSSRRDENKVVGFFKNIIRGIGNRLHLRIASQELQELLNPVLHPLSNVTVKKEVARVTSQPDTNDNIPIDLFEGVSEKEMQSMKQTIAGWEKGKKNPQLFLKFQVQREIM